MQSPNDINIKLAQDNTNKRDNHIPANANPGIVHRGIAIPVDVLLLILQNCDPREIRNFIFTCKFYYFTFHSENSLWIKFLDDRLYDKLIKALKAKLSCHQIYESYPLLRKADHIPFFIRPYMPFLLHQIPQAQPLTVNPSNLFLLHREILDAIKILDKKICKENQHNYEKPKTLNYLEEHSIITLCDVFSSKTHDNSINYFYHNSTYLTFSIENISEEYQQNLLFKASIIKIIYDINVFNEFKYISLFSAIIIAFTKHYFDDICHFLIELSQLQHVIAPIQLDQIIQALTPTLLSLAYETRILKEYRPFSLLALNIRGLAFICKCRKGSFRFDADDPLCFYHFAPKNVNSCSFGGNDQQRLQKLLWYLYQSTIEKEVANDEDIESDDEDDEEKLVVDQLFWAAFHQICRPDFLNGEHCFALFVKSLFTYLKQWDPKDKLGYVQKLTNLLTTISTIEHHGMANIHLFFYGLINTFYINDELINLLFSISSNYGFTKPATFLQKLGKFLQQKNYIPPDILNNMLITFINSHGIDQAILMFDFIETIQPIINERSELHELITLWIVNHKSSGFKELITTFRNLNYLKKELMAYSSDIHIQDLLLLTLTENYHPVAALLTVLENFAKEKINPVDVLINDGLAPFRVLLHSCIKTAQIFGLDGYNQLTDIIHKIDYLKNNLPLLLPEYILRISIAMMTGGFNKLSIHSVEILKSLAATANIPQASSNNSLILKQGLFNHAEQNTGAADKEPQPNLSSTEILQINQLITALQNELKNENHSIVMRNYLKLCEHDKQTFSLDKQRITLEDEILTRLSGSSFSFLTALSIKSTQFFTKRSEILAKTLTQAKLSFLLSLREIFNNSDACAELSRAQIIEQAIIKTRIFFPSAQFDVRSGIIDNRVGELIAILTGSSRAENISQKLQPSR